MAKASKKKTESASELETEQMYMEEQNFSVVIDYPGGPLKYNARSYGPSNAAYGSKKIMKLLGVDESAVTSITVGIIK